MREPVVPGLDPGAVDQHLGVGGQSGKRATEVAVDLLKKKIAKLILGDEI